MKTNILFAATVAACLSAPTFAHDGETHGVQPRIDDHAPIGVMADHYHKKGEWMASLRYMGMSMNDPVNPMMGPQDMSMSMVMAGLMYAPSDKLTLAAMLNYTDTSMDMIMMGNETVMGASEIGDARLSAIMPLYADEDSRLIVTFGASIPLGDTGETNPMGGRMALTMQPGTGSWGITPSLTYSRFMDGWSFGAQANAKLWLDDNSYGEQMGDSFELTSWASVVASEDVSFSVRSSYMHKSSVSGSAFPILTDKREAIVAYAGANVRVFGQRFAAEVGLPLWQDRGINALDTGLQFTLGWQKAF